MSFSLNQLFAVQSVPAEYQADYDKEWNRANLQSARVFAMLGVTLVPASAVLDLLTSPSHLYTFGVLRICMSISCLVLFLLGGRRNGEHFGTLISMGTMFVCGAGIATMIRLLGYSSPYYAGLNLIYLAAMTAPWGATKTAVACSVVYCLYFVPILFFDLRTLDIPSFVNNNVFQLETIIIAIAINHFQSERRKRETLNRLIIARQSAELEERDRYKSEFLSNITHELKTPLAIVIGTNDIITKKVADRIPGLTGLSRIVQQGAYQLAAHIDRIISVSRLDNPPAKLEFQPCNYCGIVHTLQGLFAAKAEYEQIAYTVDCPERLIVNGDNMRLQEVLVNLIQNAFKFTPKGGSIRVNVFEQNNQVVTEVIDTGIGIPAGKIDRIFNRLFQADGVLSKRHGGIGLGLHIVKTNVELHRGTVVVQSIEGAGSTFSVSLPLHADQNARLWADSDANPFEYRQTLQADELASMAIVADLAPFENQNPSWPTVLIVEDNPGMMQVMIEALREDYNVMLAAGAREALDKLARSGNSISLILSDIMMPAMSGFDFCKEVMAHAEYKKIPLIFVTALMSEEEQINGFSLGATDYITKPFSIRILKEKVDHWIARRQYEQLLENLSAELEVKVQQLAQTKDIILHEVRNPVQTIAAAESLMKSIPAGGNSEFTEYRALLHSGVQGLRNVLESVQQLDTLTAASRAAISPQSLIEEALKQTGHLLGSITVSKEFGRAEGAMVLVNRQMLVQVLVNMIRNAAEAIHSRGSAVQGAIRVSAAVRDSRIELSIADNGSGIDPESMSKLFQFKYTTKRDGTGIGLHLSKMLVRLNDGSIDVESVPGKGTIFSICLPIGYDKHLSAAGSENELAK